MSQGSEDLQARLSALCARFSRLALQLADAGHDLRERATLPPESLPVEIGAALTAFDELRARVAVVAGGVDSLVGLPDLEAAIKTLVEKEERRARQQAEEARRKAEEAARRRAEEEARRKAEEETRRKAAEEARRKVEEEARRQAEQEARRQAEEEARRRAEDEARRRVVEAPHRAAEGQGQGTMATGPGTPTKATEEAGARWWVSAAGAWKEQCARGVAFADVLRQEIGRFPYLFSVPIQESAQYGGGQLAAAYAVVLHHVERRSPGFVNLAQERAGAGDGLGLRLYQQLAGEGRLTETYADLVREVVVAAVPSPGVWIDAGLSETEAATARFERSSSKIGSPELRPLRVPDEQRFGAHRFTFTVAPFTARFVRVNASELREPRSVEIMLKVGEAASDHAWILTVGAGAASGSQGPLLRHSRAGTSVTGLGQEWSAVWIAVFNADADTSQASELTVTLRRGPVAKPSAFARAAPKLR